MTIGNIYIKIHFFFYVFMSIALFTGQIRDFLVVTCIIVIHEMGHIFGGFLFGWGIKSVILLPFGGLTIFNTNINVSILEQFIVSFLGPFFQIVFFVCLDLVFDISSRVVFFNYALLFFNLLPIIPLDGGKILNAFLCLLLPFKLSHIVCIFVSFVFCGLIFIVDWSLISLLICIFLCFSTFKEVINHKYLFNRFLYERYSYNFDFRREIVVNSVYKMHLNCRHLFFIDNKYYTEKNILSKRFDNRYKIW